ncbi:MFS transporter (plasmid) [Haloarcula salina]|uniref:MFS transporter n=1 Tax=Haloarcula salina TaxID=1429914 RepID=UPI003C6FC983
MTDTERYAIWFVTLAHMVVHMYELAIPVLVTVWIAEFSVNRAVIGTIVTIGYGLYGVGALPGGILADRYDSQQFIVACLVGMGLSFFLLSFSGNVVVLTVALGLWGLAGSVYHPTGLALLSRGFTQRGKAFGYHGMGANAGTVTGPLVTALLLFVFDWTLVAALLALPAMAVALFGLRIDIDEEVSVPESRADEQTGRRDRDGFLDGVLADSRYLFASGFAVVLAVVIFNGLFYRGLLTFLPGILGDLVSAQASPGSLLRPDSPALARVDVGNYLFSGILVLGMGGQYLGGRLTDYIPPERGLTVTLGLLAVSSLLSGPAMAMGLTPMLAVATVTGFLLFTLQPFAQVTIADHSAPDLRGLSFGYTYFVVFGVGSFAAGMIGYVLTYSTVRGAFLVLAGIAALGGVTSYVLLERRGSVTAESDGVSSD